MRLNRSFFNRPTTIVACRLLGKYLVRKVNNRIIKARIIETEAYCGTKDLACHASKGLTPRTKVMFGQPGHAYVYMIYGMYYCFNIVTGKEGYPAAVLIRGVEGLRGPGVLCRELKIDKRLSGIDICTSGELWVEEGEKIKPTEIKKGKRIGVDYAGKYRNKSWRFFLG